jgi:uncharacterized protein (UPF0333 family)
MKLCFRAPNLSQKAQAATEYMIIAAFIMAASGIVFFYATQYSNESLSVSRASESVETVAAAVDYVYALGYGTQTAVNIELPGNIVNSKVADREIMLVIENRGQTSDIVAPTITNASGSLPTSKGIHLVIVNYTETGVVVG